MEPPSARLLFFFNTKKKLLNFQNVPFRTITFKGNCIKTKEKTNVDEKYRVYCFGLSEHGALGLKKDPRKNVNRFYAKPVRHFFAEENHVTNISSGYGFSAFSVLTRNANKVFGCGINTDFQIGKIESPQKVHLDIVLKPAPLNLGLKCPETQVTTLSAGRAHLAVLTDKEGVFLSGSNCYGQCGREVLKEDKLNGTFIVSNIKDINNEEIVDICCGQDHTLFITKSLKVWAIGWGCDGQTGLGHTTATSIPCRVGGDIENERIVKVVGQSDCVLALSDKGEVFGWGNNEYHQLSEEKDVQQINFPTKLHGINCVGRIVDIAAGGSFCLAANEAGDAFVWGYGILGGGPELQKSAKPINLPRTLFGYSEYTPDAKVTRVFCGMSHLAAINCYGHLYTWGRNRHGCLGIGHTRDQYFPYKVAFSGLAEKVSCGVDHTMILCKPLFCQNCAKAVMAWRTSMLLCYGHNTVCLCNTSIMCS